MENKTKTNEIEGVMASKISHLIIEDEIPMDNFPQEKESALQ